MYADDTTIYFSLDEFPRENREIAVNSELEKVNTWLKRNKLSINVNKTKCMFFTKRRHLTPLQFLMNNRSIDVVQHFNYLGIMLDENMSWKTHIAMVRNKLSRINGILHRLKYYFPQNILITLYKYINLCLLLILIMGHYFGDKQARTWIKFRKKLLEL